MLQILKTPLEKINLFSQDECSVYNINRKQLSEHRQLPIELKMKYHMQKSLRTNFIV